MSPEAKEALYMFMDFLDSMVKTSRSGNKLINIDENELKKVKQEIFSLINDDNAYLVAKNDYNFSISSDHNKKESVNSKKKELIGVLPAALSDRKLFPKNEDVAKLLEKSLHVKIERWAKIKREEIIGHVISEIAKRDESEVEIFLNAWNKFEKNNKFKIEENEIITNKIKKQSQNFVDSWLDFFDNYKDGKL